MFNLFLPPKTDIVVVSDFFIEDLIGGAELTLEAILKKAPGNKAFHKLHSRAVTTSLIDSGKSMRWILVNFSGMTHESLVHLATSGIAYDIIECDYKYCKYRSSHLHKLQTGVDCDCHLAQHGKFVSGLFKRAQKVHFMSEGQRGEYLSLFPKMKEWPNEKLRVQGSTFDDATLGSLNNLYSLRVKDGHNNKWAVLSGGSWIKDQQRTEEYCKANKLDYELIGGMKPEDFIKKLSEYKGLVFHPAGFDTAPRLTMEAKLLGLELDLNSNVQHKDEQWFVGPREECYESLINRADRFWEELEF